MDFANWMKDGGPFMWPILLCGVVGAAVTIERAVYVYGRAGIDARGFMAVIQRALLDGDTDGALRQCSADPGAALPRVIKAGLVRADRPVPEVRAGMDEAQAEVFPQINKRLALLPMLANVSTLLGLLGTIQGLIVSFHSVGEATAEQRSAKLAEGIAVAMYTTYFGLLVAIPIMVAHALIADRANGVLDAIDHAALKLANLLEARRASGRGPAPETPSGDGPNVVPFRS